MKRAYLMRDIPNAGSIQKFIEEVTQWMNENGKNSETMSMHLLLFPITAVSLDQTIGEKERYSRFDGELRTKLELLIRVLEITRADITIRKEQCRTWIVIIISFVVGFASIFLGIWSQLTPTKITEEQFNLLKQSIESIAPTKSVEAAITNDTLKVEITNPSGIEDFPI